MADGRDAARRPVRAPLRQRSRRRWLIAGGVVVGWVAADRVTGSFLGATVLLVVVAGLGAATVFGLRAMGITRDHPWIRRMSTRPWRDGQSVLNVAVSHLSEVFVVTPGGRLIAPDIVELQMNPGDFTSLRQWMELDIVTDSVTEAYRNEVAKRGARFTGSCQPEVYIIPDDSLPQGRYQLRRGLPTGARPAPDYRDLPDSGDRQLSDDADEYGDDADEYGYVEYAVPAPAPVSARPADARPADGGRGRRAAAPGETVVDGMATVLEQIRPAVPVLRLVTGSSVAETTMSGARAGRGAVELELPDVPTVSRVHATFTFAAGCWWVTNKGANGLSVNGVPVSDKHALSDGDSIRWGKRSDAPQSRVEIG